MSSTRPIVIDTDAGWDDWLALLFLMRCTAIEILGVTVTGVGEAHLTPGSRNIQQLLSYGGSSANVYLGARKPLMYSNMFPATFRAQIDSFWGKSIPQPGISSPVISSTSAVDFLYQTFVEAAQKGTPVDVLCIGGFTNFAMLLAERPLDEYRAGIGTIYTMAGAVYVPGNVYSPNDDTWGYYANNKTAEWNVFVDAKAAQMVLGSGLRIVLVPLDATNEVPVTTTFVESYGRAAGSNPYAEFIASLLVLQAGQTDFFDPLAAAVLLTQSDPSLVTQRSVRLKVSTDLDEENDTTGALTLTDDPSCSEIVVCTSANGAVFEQIFSTVTISPLG